MFSPVSVHSNPAALRLDMDILFELSILFDMFYSYLLGSLFLTNYFELLNFDLRIELLFSLCYSVFNVN